MLYLFIFLIFYYKTNASTDGLLPYLDRFYPHINLNIPFAQYG